MSEIKKYSLFFCELCVDIILKNIPSEILEDLGLTKNEPCKFGDDENFKRLYDSIDWNNKNFIYKLSDKEINYKLINKKKDIYELNDKEANQQKEIVEYSINPAGSLANTFYTINRLSNLKEEAKIIFSYELDSEDKVEKSFIKNIKKENIKPIYLTKADKEINRLVKVCCMSSTNKEDKEKRMISSKMASLKLNEIIEQKIQKQLKQAKDIIIEGFFYYNNQDVVDFILKQAKAEIKVGLTLPSKDKIKDIKEKILNNISDDKIHEIYGNEEEINELFGNIDLCKFSEEKQLIILETKGKDGSILFENGKKYTQKAIYLSKNDFINTMGAGDTFLAGFLKAKELNLENKEALSSATILATEILKKSYGSLSCEDIKEIVDKEEKIKNIKILNNLQKFEREFEWDIEYPFGKEEKHILDKYNIDLLHMYIEI